jgi:hypothetical protein
MAHKYGEKFVDEMIDRGWRELGGLFYEGSNIAQPMYPLHGRYGASKDLEGPEPTEKEPSFEDLHPVDVSRDDHGKDDRGMDLDRE